MPYALLTYIFKFHSHSLGNEGNVTMTAYEKFNCGRIYIYISKREYN